MNEYVCITTLVEDTTSTAGFYGEHGLSFCIEYDGRQVLFDTGQSDSLLKNTKLLGVEVADTIAIILSHGHYDHTGGLSSVLNVAPQAMVYMHPDALRPKYSRKGAEIRAIGMSNSTRQAVRTHAQNGKIVWSEESTMVMPRLFVTGQIPRNTDFEDVGGDFYVDEKCEQADMLYDDQAVFFDTSRGLIVLLGCCHAGVVNTLDYIVKLSGKTDINSVMGGMHLLNASQDRIEQTVSIFRKYNVQNIGFGHCTGENATQGIHKAFPNRCFVFSTGSRVNL